MSDGNTVETVSTAAERYRCQDDGAAAQRARGGGREACWNAFRRSRALRGAEIHRVDASAKGPMSRAGRRACGARRPSRAPSTWRGGCRGRPRRRPSPRPPERAAAQAAARRGRSRSGSSSCSSRRLAERRRSGRRSSLAERRCTTGTRRDARAAARARSSTARRRRSVDAHCRARSHSPLMATHDSFDGGGVAEVRPLKRGSDGCRRPRRSAPGSARG